MRERVVVFGGGRIGTPMAVDLACDREFDVTVADLSEQTREDVANLRNRMLAVCSVGHIDFVQHDLNDTDRTQALATEHDYAINAAPAFLGHKTLEVIINANRHVVDITFGEEDPFGLDALAKEKNVIAVIDCGVAPGMSNLLAGYADSQLDTTDSVRIYVGGVPSTYQQFPNDYFAVFAPQSVIDEYTRPARFRRNGEIVTMPALSEPEILEFDGVDRGTLEAFNSDGSRSLLGTMRHVPNLIEKTLRYPSHDGYMSHREVMEKLRDAGRLDLDLIMPYWKMRPEHRDMTVMRIIVEGQKDGHDTRYTYDLCDKYDEVSGIHSMARTTGYVATSALRMIANGDYTERGISPPEFVGRDSTCVQSMLKDQQARGIEYKETVERT
jgi:lysine 6-dehydrogenase